LSSAELANFNAVFVDNNDDCWSFEAAPWNLFVKLRTVESQLCCTLPFVKIWYTCNVVVQENKQQQQKTSTEAAAEKGPSTVLLIACIIVGTVLVVVNLLTLTALSRLLYVLFVNNNNVVKNREQKLSATNLPSSSSSPKLTAVAPPMISFDSTPINDDDGTSQLIRLTTFTNNDGRRSLGRASTKNAPFINYF
jgi:hypothetical protein